MSLNLLSLSRPLTFLAVLVLYMVQPNVSVVGMGIYAVSAAFFVASSAIVVEWIPTSPRWRDAVLWAEIVAVTLVCGFTMWSYNSNGIQALYMPIAVTIPIIADRRRWGLGFGLVIGSWILTSLLPGTGPELFLSMVVYGAALLFFSSTGVLMRNLQDTQAESRRLLAEVTESRSALERAHRQLQESAARQQEMAVLEERARLAREIHDSVAHGLTVLVVQTQAARKLFDREPQRALETVARCEEMAREALQETRRAVRALHPSGLEQQRDVEALRRLARDFTMATTMQVDVVADPAAVALPPDHNRLEQLFRIFQEALTNAHRHGHARSARADLAVAEGMLHLVISNDGLPPASLDPGVGLKSMSERVRSLGGDLNVEPLKNGLQLRIAVPVQHEEAAR